MADSPLLALVKQDVEDLKEHYAKSVADGYFEVGELFGLLAAGAIDAIRAVESVPGATASEKKDAAVETLVLLAGVAIDSYSFSPSVPAVVVSGVIKPALLEVVKYFANGVVGQIADVLVSEGVLKAT